MNSSNSKDKGNLDKPKNTKGSAPTAGNLTGLDSWIRIHIDGTCTANPPSMDCLISLAQCVQKEVNTVVNSKAREG